MCCFPASYFSSLTVQYVAPGMRVFEIPLSPPLPLPFFLLFLNSSFFSLAISTETAKGRKPKRKKGAKTDTKEEKKSDEAERRRCGEDDNKRRRKFSAFFFVSSWNHLGEEREGGKANSFIGPENLLRLRKKSKFSFL